VTDIEQLPYTPPCRTK